MSRIGKLPVSIPAGVTVTLKDNVVNVKGPKGELSQFVNPAIEVEIADGHVVLKENENAMLDNLKCLPGSAVRKRCWTSTAALAPLRCVLQRRRSGSSARRSCLPPSGTPRKTLSATTSKTRSFSAATRRTSPPSWSATACGRMW